MTAIKANGITIEYEEMGVVGRAAQGWCPRRIHEHD
jgi:hypothetical protein